MLFSFRFAAAYIRSTFEGSTYKRQCCGCHPGIHCSLSRFSPVRTILVGATGSL